ETIDAIAERYSRRRASSEAHATPDTEDDRGRVRTVDEDRLVAAVDRQESGPEEMEELKTRREREAVVGVPSARVDDAGDGDATAAVHEAHAETELRAQHAGSVYPGVVTDLREDVIDVHA